MFGPPAETAEQQEVSEGSLGKQEQLVEQYIKQDNQEAAAKLLFELIVKYAKQKNFNKAEALRDKLYEAAPMALNEIVKSGEIIEEEKSQSIDQNHLKIWRDLYDRLESGEASELYYTMKPCSFTAGQAVFKQGDNNPNLYFVQDGQLDLSRYDQKHGQEKVLKQLKAGDVANLEPFFSFTVCTTSLTAISESKLTCLENSILAKWTDTFPGLEAKLSSFCHGQNKVSDLVKKTGADLRAHERFIVSHRAVIQLLDNAGKPVQNPFKISLFDISAGGFSFGLKINKKEQAAQFLGHQLYMQTVYRLEGTPKKVGQKGKIVAVHLQPFGESSIHVQFQSPLDEKIVATIARQTPQTE
jgi:CRP-like cAMP-binding protein